MEENHMAIQDSILLIQSNRLQNRLNKKYSDELEGGTADAQTVLNHIQRWRNAQAFFLVLACIFTLGITPFIYLCVAAAKNKGLDDDEKRSLSIVKRPGELIHEASIDLQELIDNPVTDSDESDLYSKSSDEVINSDEDEIKKKVRFGVLDGLKDGVDRTHGSRILPNNQVVAFQRLRENGEKNLCLRVFARDNLLIPIDSIHLVEGYIFLRGTLTAVNENVVAMMGYCEDDDTEQLFHAYVFLWNKADKSMEQVYIGHTKGITPEDQITKPQIILFSDTVFAKLMDKVTIFSVNNIDEKQKKRLTSKESIFYPFSDSSYFETTSNRQEVFYIAKAPEYTSNSDHMNPFLASLEADDAERLSIHTFTDKTHLTACTYDPHQKLILLGVSDGKVLEFAFDGKKVKLVSFTPCQIESKPEVKNIIVSQDGKYTVIHYKGNALHIKDNEANTYVYVTPQSEDLDIKSFENSGFNRGTYIASFDNLHSEIRFVNGGQHIMYCNSEITVLITDIAGRFEAVEELSL